MSIHTHYNRCEIGNHIRQYVRGIHRIGHIVHKATETYDGYLSRIGENLIGSKLAHDRTVTGRKPLGEHRRFRTLTYNHFRSRGWYTARGFTVVLASRIARAVLIGIARHKTSLTLAANIETGRSLYSALRIGVTGKTMAGIRTLSHGTWTWRPYNIFTQAKDLAPDERRSDTGPRTHRWRTQLRQIDGHILRIKGDNRVVLVSLFGDTDHLLSLKVRPTEGDLSVQVRKALVRCLRFASDDYKRIGYTRAIARLQHRDVQGYLNRLTPCTTV